MPARRFATVVAGIALALRFAPPSSADSLLINDDRGDVATSTDGTFVAATRATYPDLLSARVVHRARSITLLARYRDLRPEGTTSAYGLAIRTPDGTTVPFDVITELGARDGYIEPHEGVGIGDFFCTPTSDPALRYPRWHIDYSGDRYRIRVPRSCLGRPEWVRVSFYTGVSYRDRTFLDEAGKGRVREFLTWPRALSEPLYRG